MDYLRGVNLDSRNWYAGDYEAVIDEDGVKEEYVCFTGSGDYTPEDLEEFIDEIFTSISSNCWEVDMRAVRAANRAARM